MNQAEVHSSEGAAIAERLNEELARRRISRQALADLARVSLSTLEKALSGKRPFSLATIVRIEDVLGTSLRQQNLEGPHEVTLAPEAMGSYSRQAVRWIEGSYLTLRPAFSHPGAIFAYRTEIFWDEQASYLRFTESDRADSSFSQTGFISMPNLSGHTYLVTSEAGQYRLIMLGRGTRERRMFGLLSTLQVGSGSQLVPVSCPIALVPLGQIENLHFGLIAPEQGGFADYSIILDRAVGNDFCRLVTGSE